LVSAIFGFLQIEDCELYHDRIEFAFSFVRVDFVVGKKAWQSFAAFAPLREMLT